MALGVSRRYSTPSSSQAVALAADLVIEIPQLRSPNSPTHHPAPPAALPQLTDGCRHQTTQRPGFCAVLSCSCLATRHRSQPRLEAIYDHDRQGQGAAAAWARGSVGVRENTPLSDSPCNILPGEGDNDTSVWARAFARAPRCSTSRVTSSGQAAEEVATRWTIARRDSGLCRMRQRN